MASGENVRVFHGRRIAIMKLVESLADGPLGFHFFISGSSVVLQVDSHRGVRDLEAVDALGFTASCVVAAGACKIHDDDHRSGPLTDLGYMYVRTFLAGARK